MPVKPKIKIAAPQYDWTKEPPETVEESKGMSVLIYGATGSQKTRIAASANLVPQLKPAIILDTDFSTESVNWKIPQIAIRSYDDFIKASEKALGGKYKTVIVDTGTELYQKIMLPEAMRYAMQDQRRDHDPELPEPRDYQRAHNKFKEFLRLLKDSGLNYIMTAQEEYVYDSVDREIILGVGPSISGKLNGQVGQFFGLVGRLTVNRNNVTEFHAGQEYRVITKDRKNRIPGVLEIEDAKEAMQALYDFYYGGK